MDDTNIEIVRLQERFATIQSKVDDIHADQKKQNAQLTELIALQHRRQGAQALAKMVWGVLASGGLLGWMWEHFKK